MKKKIREKLWIEMKNAVLRRAVLCFWGIKIKEMGQIIFLSLFCEMSGKMVSRTEKGNKTKCVTVTFRLKCVQENRFNKGKKK